MLIFIRSSIAFLAALAATLVAPMGCGGAMELEGNAQAIADGTIALRWGAAGTGLVSRAGETDAGHYRLALGERPPPAAFDRGIAVAEVVLVDQAEDIHLGAPLDEVLGVERSYVVVYLDEGHSEQHDELWALELAPGFHCARRGEEGYETLECADLEFSFD